MKLTAVQIKFFIISLGFFVVFVFFSFLVHKDKLTRVDFDTTARLQDQIPKTFDRVFSFHQGARVEKLKNKAETVVVDTLFSTFSEFGKFEPMLIVLVLVLFLWRKLWGIAAFGLFGFFHVIEIFGKIFVEHTPPPQFMLRTKHLVDFPQFHVRLENSYPSGHAGRAIFITILLGAFVWQSKRLSKLQKYVLLVLLGAYDVIMLVSRVYLGEHWFSDVIGGSLLGAALGLIGVVFLYTSKKHSS